MKVWAVCCYFNFTSSQFRLQNYKIFRENLKKHDVKLLTLEFDINGIYELKEEDADVLIQLTDGDLMWQKERLLNIGIDHLPTDTDIVMILDTDVIFGNEDVIDRLKKSMEKYKVVQCFSKTMQLNPYLFKLKNFDISKIDITKKYNFHEIYDNNSLVKNTINPEKSYASSTGLAWAYRYETIKKIKMFEGKIVGSGDEATSWALLRLFKKSFLIGTGNSWLEYADMIRNYVDLSEIRYLEDTVIFSLYHGEKEDRGYLNRYDIFNQYDFDSSKDLIAEEGKPFKFKENVPLSLREYIKQYFINRKENESLNF
jgi:hypothetical protein